MQNIVLINGRFELLNGPEKIDVFDMRNLKKDNDGKVIPAAVIPLDEPVNDRDAGKTALAWLRRAGYLTQSEYLNFADVFLASYPVYAPRLNGGPAKNAGSAGKQ